MRLPSDMLHAFFTMDAYAVASVSTEAGVTSHQTRVVRNNLMPIWNEKLAFEDVALGNMLSLALYDHKKLTSDVFLGQVGLCQSGIGGCLSRGGCDGLAPRSDGCSVNTVAGR